MSMEYSTQCHTEHGSYLLNITANALLCVCLFSVHSYVKKNPKAKSVLLILLNFSRHF